MTLKWPRNYFSRRSWKAPKSDPGTNAASTFGLYSPPLTLTLFARGNQGTDCPSATLTAKIASSDFCTSLRFDHAGLAFYLPKSPFGDFGRPYQIWPGQIWPILAIFKIGTMVIIFWKWAKTAHFQKMITIAPIFKPPIFNVHLPLKKAKKSQKSTIFWLKSPILTIFQRHRVFRQNLEFFWIPDFVEKISQILRQKLTIFTLKKLDKCQKIWLYFPRFLKQIEQVGRNFWLQPVRGVRIARLTTIS